jgi:hypothetical protein
MNHPPLSFFRPGLIAHHLDIVLHDLPPLRRAFALQRIASGIQAIGEIGRRTWIIGLKAW